MKSPFEDLLDTPMETFRGTFDYIPEIGYNMVTFAPIEILTEEDYEEIAEFYNIQLSME